MILVWAYKERFKEKYVIHEAFSTNIMLKGYNEVLNVGRIEGSELVHHLVKFFTLKNFHRSFTEFGH
jgi:hypothetical protein